MMATGATIEKALRDIVQVVLKQTGLGITPICSSLIDSMIVRGAAIVTNEPNRLDEAQTNLRRYLAIMTSHKEMTTDGLLHEGTFYAAESALCPLWPFC